MTADDFRVQFGHDALSDEVMAMIVAGDWCWRRLGQPARDGVIRDVVARIVDPDLEPAGSVDRWNRGWRENLGAFLATGDPADLVPRYVRAGQPVRLDGDFAATEDPRFELHWYEVLRRHVWDRWLAPCPEVWEFGCGPGHNLAAFARWDADKRYVGLDWSTPAVTCVNAVGAATGAHVIGREFDFFKPHAAARNTGLDPDRLGRAAVLTVGALEQTGQRYAPFMRWLLERKPRVVVHIEPIMEWYDAGNLVDWLAVQYLKRRRYWSGFPSFMAGLCAGGYAEILHKARCGVGSLFLEGYMLFVWRPL